MDKKIYISIDKNTKTAKKNILIGDIAEVYCQQASVQNSIEHMIVISGFNKNYITFSALKIIKLIKEKYPDYDIDNLGEPEFVLEYDEKLMKKRKSNVFIVAIASILTLIGSMYVIMAYNNDVGTVEIFEKVYDLFGIKKDKTKLLEISYGIGLAVGIIVFYNHFGGFKLGKEPTPLEIQMNKYNKDLEDTIIDKNVASEKEIV